MGGVYASLHARRPERHTGDLRAGARSQSRRPVVPVRGTPCHGRCAVCRGRARSLEASFRSGVAGVRRAAILNDRRSDPTWASSGMRGFRTRCGCSAMNTMPFGTPTRRSRLSRRLDHLYSQTIALAYAALLHQMRRRYRSRARVCGSGRGSLRAIRVRLLRRLGAGAHRLGARTAASVRGHRR